MGTYIRRAITVISAVILSGGASLPQSFGFASTAAEQEQAGCSIKPYGLIGETWNRISGRIGCAINEEHNVPNRNGRIQDFQNGQIAWSPDQAPGMTVWTYKMNNQSHIQWNTNTDYSYDFYIIRAYKDGQFINQKDISGNREGWWTYAHKQPGWYSYIVEGCDRRTFGSKCRHGWTIPVGERIEAKDIPANPPQPPPPPAQTPPTINGVTTTGNGENTVFHIRGSDFDRKAKEVTIKGVRIDADGVRNVYWTTKVRNDGTLAVGIPLPCIPGIEISFSATDGRENRQDWTHKLWSNTVPAKCP